MKRFFAFVCALALSFALPVCSAAASYDEHTQNDGMWHVEDSKGGTASSVIIRGSGSGDNSLLSGTEIKVVGKNLFDNSNDAGYISGASIEPLSTGVRVTSTRNGLYTAVVMSFLRASQFSGRSLTMNVSGISPSGSNTPHFMIGLCDDSYGNRYSMRSTSKVGSLSIVVPSSLSEIQKYLIVWFYSNVDYSSSVVGDYIDYTGVQIELGSVSTSYEPFVNPSNLVVPTNLLSGDQWDVLSGTVTRQDGSVEFYEPQSVTMPVGTVNIFSTGDVQLGAISITYNYDPSGSGGSGGSGVVASSGGSGGLNDFTSIMSAVLNLYKLDLTIYGYTFSLWQVFIFSMLIGIVVNFIGDLIFG